MIAPRLLALTLGPPLALALGSGCMNIDWAILGGDPIDAYELPDSPIPESQLEWTTFTSEDGRELHGLFAHQDPPRSPMIWFHGNGSHFATEDYWMRVAFYWSLGTHDVFVFDYRGYGLSEGPVDLGILHHDGEAAARHVAELTGVPAEDTPWVGLSLGASAAVHASAQVRSQSITTNDMFLSAERAANDGTGLALPNGWFFTERIDNLSAIAEVQAPIFITHAQADDYVRVEYSDELYAAAPEPKELWQPEGIGHADLEREIPEVYAERLAAWLARWE